MHKAVTGIDVTVWSPRVGSMACAIGFRLPAIRFSSWSQLRASSPTRDRHEPGVDVIWGLEHNLQNTIAVTETARIVFHPPIQIGSRLRGTLVAVTPPWMADALKALWRGGK